MTSFRCQVALALALALCIITSTAAETSREAARLAFELADADSVRELASSYAWVDETKDALAASSVLSPGDALAALARGGAAAPPPSVLDLATAAGAAAARGVLAERGAVVVLDEAAAAGGEAGAWRACFDATAAAHAAQPGLAFGRGDAAAAGKLGLGLPSGWGAEGVPVAALKGFEAQASERVALFQHATGSGGEAPRDCRILLGEFAALHSAPALRPLDASDKAAMSELYNHVAPKLVLLLPEESGPAEGAAAGGKGASAADLARWRGAVDAAARSKGLASTFQCYVAYAERYARFSQFFNVKFVKELPALVIFHSQRNQVFRLQGAISTKGVLRFVDAFRSGELDARKPAGMKSEL